MAHHQGCSLKGKLVDRAQLETGELVTLAQALRKEKRGPYYCPDQNCHMGVVPEGKTIVRAGGYERRGHFNTLPTVGLPEHIFQKKTRDYNPLEAITLSLESTGDFSFVGTHCTYQSTYRKKGEGECVRKKFPVDITAKMNDGTDVILHVVELPSPYPASKLYHQIKEISVENIDDHRKRVIKPRYGPIGELGRKVYQNIIVIKNNRSFGPAEGGRTLLVPWVHYFIHALTGDIHYFNPLTMRVETYQMMESAKFEGEHPKDSRMTARMKLREELSDITFTPLDKGILQREISNREEGFVINIGNWKIAKPQAVIYDQDGKPISKDGKGGQRQMIL